MNTLQLAKLKQHLLQEIEELGELNMPGPDDGYPLSEPKIKSMTDAPFINKYYYYYENSNQIDMEISITSKVFGDEYDTKVAAKGPKSLQISFGVAIDDQEGYLKAIYKLQKVAANKKSDLISKASPEVVDLKYSASTGANDFLKVLATVVNATKDVMEREGGEDEIRDISFSPSDRRRANVYDHYIKTLFPKFVKKHNWFGDDDDELFTYVNKKYLQNK